MRGVRGRKKNRCLWLSGLSLLAALLLAFSFIGCSKDQGTKGKFRIALLMKAKTNPFFQAMEDGARQAALQLGVDLIAMGITRETDVQQQINQIENMIAQRVDAMLVTPADSKAIIGALLKAQEKGILIINVDNRLDPQTVEEKGLRLAAYVGADNERGGYMAGKFLIQTLKKRKPGKKLYKVAMLEGIRGVDNAEARKRGFLKAVEEDPSVQLVDSQTANWDMQQATNVFGDMLRAHGDLDGLFCANDMMALGAIRALEEQKKSNQVVVVSYDNIRAAQRELLRGTLAGTIEQHPELMGEYAVREAFEALQGKKIDKEVLVPLELITAEKLKEGKAKKS